MANQLIYHDYKASGKVSTFGLIFLLVATTIVGILAGLVAAGIAQFVYLIVAFPIFMITIGAATVGKVAKTGKIRNRLIFALFGLWMGSLMYGTYWTGEYLFLVEEFFQEYREDGFTRFDALSEVSAGLKEDTGYPHVIGYVLWSIEGGLQLITTTPGSEAPLELNPQQTAIYWSVELIAVVLFTAIMAFIFGNKPFSESCNEWYDKAEVEFVGHVLNENGKRFIEYLRAGDLEQATNLVNMEEGNTELFAYYFVNCDSDEVLLKTVRHQGQNVIEVNGIMSKSAFSQFKTW